MRSRKRPQKSGIIFMILEALNRLFRFVFSVTAGTIGVGCGLLSGFLQLMVLLIICGAVAGGVIYVKIKPELNSAMSMAYDKIANIRESDFYHAADTYVFDSDGNKIGMFNAGHFIYAPIEDISPYVQEGYIAQEDRRFKTHHGVDFLSIGRAALSLVKHKGEIAQGGSTITQQVVKNVYLSQERTYRRKLVEFLVAPALEQKFSKPKIMEFYCNTNYYGNRCYGIQAASRFYFGKDAKDLLPDEAAMLVGLSNAPAVYDPIAHEDKALEKRNAVLKNMYECGVIDRDQYDRARKKPLVIVQEVFDQYLETYQSAYALHCAAIELMKADGFGFKYTFSGKQEYDEYIDRYESAYDRKMNQIKESGYKIYTTLDSNIQQKVQERIDDGLSGFTELQDNGKYAMQGAAVVVDNSTGAVKAIVGGRGTEDPFNRAYLSARQPGSSIKPLIDYAPAFDTGWYSPSTIVDDHYFEGGPKNSGGTYRGEITVREAVNRSINTVAWQVLQKIGVEKGMQYLAKMRFHKLTYVDNGVNALSIGGFTNGVRVVDMAKGYAALADNGLYIDTTCITAIKDQKDNDVIKIIPETEQVYGPDSAFLMTDVLEDTISQPYGTGYGLGLESGMPSAGKTGTTNSNKDTWFCGYTPYYTAAVWVGYDVPRAMPGVYGATYAGKIWKNIMDDVNEGLEYKEFPVPETIEVREYEWGEDYYSTAAERKREEAEAEAKKQKALNNIKRDIDLYLVSSISSVEETYLIDEAFREIVNRVAEIEDAGERQKNYDAIRKHYDDLLAVKESMADVIAAYEEQKRDEEWKAAIAKQQSAADERKKQDEKLKVNAFDLAIEEIKKAKYRPGTEITESLIRDAEEKLEALREYGLYSVKAEEYEDAVLYLYGLDDEEVYQEKQAAAEEAKRLAEEEKEALMAETIEEAKREAERRDSVAKAKVGEDPSKPVEKGPGVPPVTERQPGTESLGTERFETDPAYSGEGGN